MNTLATSSTDDLLAAAPDAFRALITANLRTTAPDELWQLLLSPAVADRTIAALRECRARVLADLERRRSRADRHWRSGAMAYLHRLDNRCTLVEAATGHSILPSTNVDPTADSSLAAAVVTLAQAIRDHRAGIAADLYPEPADTRLWDLVDHAVILHPDGRREPLSTWAPVWDTTTASASAVQSHEGVGYTAAVS